MSLHLSSLSSSCGSVSAHSKTTASHERQINEPPSHSMAGTSHGGHTACFFAAGSCGSAGVGLGLGFDGPGKHPARLLMMPQADRTELQVRKTVLNQNGNGHACYDYISLVNGLLNMSAVAFWLCVVSYVTAIYSYVGSALHSTWCSA